MDNGVSGIDFAPAYCDLIVKNRLHKPSSGRIYDRRLSHKIIGPSLDPKINQVYRGKHANSRVCQNKCPLHGYV